MLVYSPFAPLSRLAYDSSVRPLPDRSVQSRRRFWQPGCPVPISQLVAHRVALGSTAGAQGSSVVNGDVADSLQRCSEDLEVRSRAALRLDELYGPGARDEDGDVSGSSMREAVPSPCTGGTGSGSWSNHAYGHAIDLNPVENPYIGCGRVHDPASRPFVDRTRLRRGMVTPAVVRAFRSIGWGWGGDWTGRTKDYMHFSTTGH